MTRWKRECGFTEIRMMHAHNQYSHWHDAVLSAAHQLGLVVLYREYANHYDGSKDRAWVVSTRHLDAIGGRPALDTVAREIHEQQMAEV